MHTTDYHSEVPPHCTNRPPQPPPPSQSLNVTAIAALCDGAAATLRPTYLDWRTTQRGRSESPRRRRSASQTARPHWRLRRRALACPSYPRPAVVRQSERMAILDERANPPTVLSPGGRCRGKSLEHSNTPSVRGVGRPWDRRAGEGGGEGVREREGERRKV